jgi:hypothetical protein
VDRHQFTITGNGVVISLSNANVTTQQILSISGNQANVSVSTLKFWIQLDLLLQKLGLIFTRQNMTNSYNLQYTKLGV